VIAGVMVEADVVDGTTLRGETRATGAAPATATAFVSLTIVSASASFSRTSGATIGSAAARRIAMSTIDTARVLLRV